MSKDNDGGPAFPPQVVRDSDGLLQEVTVYGMQSGMSLRDYFAAAALQGMLACPQQPQSGPDMYARDAYKLADAMLAERAA